jgi:hypothetical protein
VPGATTVPNEALAEPFKERHHQRHSAVLGLIEEVHGTMQMKLELVDSKTFTTGVLYLTYRPTRG